VTSWARSRAMSRSGCVDGPGIGSSDNGGTDSSRSWRGDVGSGFKGGEAIETGGKNAGVNAVAVFTEIEGGMGGGTTSVVRWESLGDGFCC